MFKSIMIFIFFSLGSVGAYAKIDLVTLPIRDQVQLTIYNPADLTLVREQRTLTLKPGINRLELSWAETLIDPTSVYLEAPQHKGQVNLLEVSYLPHVKESAIWVIESQVSGEVLVEISFFTSGITWNAFYMATLSTDEQSLHLQNEVRINNQSGEDYLNAKTRVIVGKIHLLDEIAQLAKQNPPYGMPIEPFPFTDGNGTLTPRLEEEIKEKSVRSIFTDSVGVAPKQIIKEGLSEYFIYTIEGTESIPNGWGKRLPALDKIDIPVQVLYRYDEQRYGTETQQLLFFKNDQEHHLGETPLPDGQVIVYRQLAENQHLSYVGQLQTQYIPVGQEVEFNLGTAKPVKVEPILMDYKTENYLFDYQGQISGFDRIQEWQLKLTNNRDIPVEIEIFRQIEHPYWNVTYAPDLAVHYEKIDLDTIKYRLTLPPHTKEYLLPYTLTLFEGERQSKKTLIKGMAQ
ncbi:MAG: hypothetical protein HC877_06940 [Thioploca sp.]|nr:hypothetical protein [Thioploca sp.]